MKRKPGRKPVFTEQDVIDAAFAIGVDHFTLSQVADRLGVAAAALYRLFGSRDEIVHACIRYAADSVRPPQRGQCWREVLTALAEECWRLCEAYPGLDRVLSSYPSALAHFEELLRTWSEPLVELGKTPGQVRFAADLISSTTMMTHSRLQRFGHADGGEPAVAEPVPVPGPGETVEPVCPGTDRGTFELQISFLLDALESNWPDQDSPEAPAGAHVDAGAQVIRMR